MALTLEPLAEPIPGYRLIEKLGSGGFGDVWKAEAPGGLFKAIKIVRGDIGKLDADGAKRADQELRALRRVQGIRHPYLLTIDRYDIINDQLIIVTELADGNLYDRFEQFVKEGQKGIPRPLLLRYLHEAAEALDLMNGQHNLQHLDIKPQNLFLIHDHVKVADFGLVRDLQGVRSETTAAVTPLYAAPETFDSDITPYCDQYSLAIVYQELLTGHRPFGGATIQQLAMQHLKAPPNLSPLPHADRPAVAKALSKKPGNRHPSCTALIDALLAGSAEPPQPKIAARVSDAPRAKHRDLPNINESIRRLEKKGTKPFRPETPPTMVRIRKGDVAPVIIDEPDRRNAPPEFHGDGVLFPALVVGLGRTGLLALKQLRQSLSERFGGMSALPNIQLLYIDSDPETADLAIQGAAGSALDQDEVLLTRLNRASHYLKPRRNGRSIMEGWFDAQWLYRIPRNPAVHGQRALGRLVFGDWYQPITDRFVDLLEAATEPDSLQRADKNTVLGIRTNRPRAYVIANLGGGSGGGAFIDVAYALRNRLKTLGYESPNVIGLLNVSKVDNQTPAQLNATANTYAALKELAHYHHLDSTYLCTFDDRDAAWRDAEPPFSRMAILPSDCSSGDALAARTADFLLRELTQQFGEAADQARMSTLKMARPTTEACAATFGIASMAWPRQALVRAASRKLCEIIVDRWARRDPHAIRPAIQKWVAQQWQAEKFGSDALMDRFQTAIQTVVNEPIDALFARLSQRLTPKGWFGGHIDSDAAHDAHSRWHEILGRPEANVVEHKVGVIGEGIAQSGISVTKEWGGRLAQLAVTLIEQPEFRMSGAEEAISQFRQRLDEMHAIHVEKADQFAAKSLQMHESITHLIAHPSGRRAATDLSEFSKSYPTNRLNELLHHQAAMVCGTLSNDLGEQLGEVRFCRKRLDELVEGLRSDTESMRESPHYLLPAGCTTIDDAVAHVIREITEVDLCELDRRMQKMLQSQFMALVHVCMSTSDMFSNLEPAMMKLATQFVAGRVGSANAAALFLERHEQMDAAAAAINQAFDDAAPTLGDNIGTAVSEFVTLTVPPGTAGERFAEVAKDALDHDEVTIAVGHDDVSFYRELPRVPLSKLPQFGVQARECYDRVAEHDRTPPHTRYDVDEWLLPR